MSETDRQLLALVRSYGQATILYHAALAHLDAMTILHKGANIDPRTASSHPLYLAVVGRNYTERTRNERLAQLDAALLRGVAA